MYASFNDVNVSVCEEGGGGAGADPALVTWRGPNIIFRSKLTKFSNIYIFFLYMILILI